MAFDGSRNLVEIDEEEHVVYFDTPRLKKITGHRIGAIFGMSVGIFTDMIVKSVTVFDIILFYVKTIIFGFFISVIPLYNGWKTQYRSTDFPVSVLSGMMGVFMSIVLVEIVSLVARFFLNSL